MNNKTFEGIKVLIVDGYARQSLCMAKALKQMNVFVAVICYSVFDVSYASRYPSKKILHKCDKQDISEQERFVIEEIKKGEYDLVIPMTDASAMYLSKKKKELEQYAKIAVEDWEKFVLAIDKLNTMRIGMNHNIRVPKTLCTTDPIGELDRGTLQFPVVVKPRTAAGSIGFNIVHNRQQLCLLLDHYDNANGPLLIQEYIQQNGPQYGAEVFRDRNGIIKSCLIVKIPRWFPLDGGSRVLSISIHDGRIAKACKDLLNAIDWKGYANIDLVYDSINNEPVILEINPRTGASIKINFECGVNLAQLILENELGYAVTDMTSYPDNKQVSCFLVDFLWFLKSKDRFRATPSWFNRIKIKDIIFSWDNPLPFLAFCIQSIQYYRRAMKQRERKT